jgi:hypothetical protein
MYTRRIIIFLIFIFAALAIFMDIRSVKISIPLTNVIWLLVFLLVLLVPGTHVSTAATVSNLDRADTDDPATVPPRPARPHWKLIAPLILIGVCAAMFVAGLFPGSLSSGVIGVLWGCFFAAILALAIQTSFEPK